MMKKLNVLLGAAALLMSGTAMAQTQVEPFRPGVTVQGVNYFLPKTEFKVVLTADKSVTLPGEFAAYANRFLSLSQVPTTETTIWTLKTISLFPYGVPDAKKAYSVQLKAKTSAPLISLSQEGIILGVNVEVEEEDAPALPQGTKAPKAVNGRDFMSRDILAAGSTSKMAQLTAEEIYDIRESRNDLIRGNADNAPKDGAQLQLMLDKLDQQEQALASLFKGQTLTNTEVFSFDYEPSATLKEEGDTVLLCRFSRMLGLVAQDDLAGEPIWMSLKYMGNLPQVEADPKAAKAKAKIQQGLYYNVPARVQVKLFTAEQELLSTEVMMPQYGTVEILSDALFNKKMDTQVTFDQNTGNYTDLK